MTSAASPKVETFELDYPVDFKGAAINRLNIRRPKGSDLRWLPKGGDVSLEQMYPFFSLLCGVEEAVFDEMDASDLARFGEIINGFLSSKKSKTARPPRPGAH